MKRFPDSCLAWTSKINKNKLYLPIYFWCQRELERLSDKRPLFIGINGPQGSGKTTLTKALVESFKFHGVEALAISIDDFYLTRVQQIELAKKYHENPYLQMRGYPGTHDIHLGLKVFQDLCQRGKWSKYVYIPRYNKSAYQGKGDRYPLEQWAKIDHSPEIIFLEGWMLGFYSLPENTVTDPYLGVINKFLEQYEILYDFLDCFIQLYPSSLKFIFEWRIEAEENMKKLGQEGMSENEIKDYIAAFMPAYKLYLEHLRKQPPCKDHLLQIMINEDRLPANNIANGLSV